MLNIPPIFSYVCYLCYTYIGMLLAIYPIRPVVS